MENSTYYFAYGSNLNLIQMFYRCRDSEIIGDTVLENYRLVFKGSKDSLGYLTIEPCKGASVPIGIFKISPRDELMLDLYEGVPTLYCKKRMSVSYNSEEINGLIYIMNHEYGYHTPSDKYIEVCKDGYTYFDFNPAVIEEALTVTKSQQHKKLTKLKENKKVSTTK